MLRLREAADSPQVILLAAGEAGLGTPSAFFPVWRPPHQNSQLLGFHRDSLSTSERQLSQHHLPLSCTTASVK